MGFVDGTRLPGDGALSQVGEIQSRDAPPPGKGLNKCPHESCRIIADFYGLAYPSAAFDRDRKFATLRVTDVAPPGRAAPWSSADGTV